jgi:hypothetical protein
MTNGLLDVDDATAGEQDKDDEQEHDDIEGTLGNDGRCCEYEDKEHYGCDEQNDE